jgi:hypothetical protein
MRLDRKFLLIAPSLVLVLVVAGLFYTVTKLRQIVEASEGWDRRDAYIASVEHGQRQLDARKAVGLVRLSLDAERRRTEAIRAATELLVVLGTMNLACAVALLLTIRRLPRTEPLRGPVLFRTAPG